MRDFRTRPLPPRRCGRPLASLAGTLLTVKDSFKLLLNHHPVAATSSTPVYSNAAFGLLGLALESISGEPFETSFANAVLKPLGVTRASWRTPPTDPNIVVPGSGKKDSWWEYDLAQDTPYVFLTW